LVVDATANLKNFEHKLTSEIARQLSQLKIPMTRNSPVLAKSFTEFADAFAIDDDWNVLLLVSHGRSVAGGPDLLQLADLRANWFLANGVDMKIADKAVFLAVCEGACEDAVYVLLRDQVALLLVAPGAPLKGTEARDFFPTVLGELLGKTEITPEQVGAAVRKHAALAAGKMKIHSAV
jgi:hypothetical protein